MAITEACKEAIWLRGLLGEIIKIIIKQKQFNRKTKLYFYFLIKSI